MSFFVKRMFLFMYLACLFLVVSSCSDNQSGPTYSNSTDETSVSVDNFQSVDDVMPVLVADPTSMINEFVGAFATKKFEVTANTMSSSVVIPISSIPVDTLITVPVIVDMWEYNILAYRDSGDVYHVSYNICEKCIALAGGHRQWAYNGINKYFVCASCMSVYNLASLGNPAARDLDKCIPLEIPAGDYEVVKMRDVEIDLQAFPWMRDDLENPNVYGVPAAPLSTLLDKDAIVISYDTLLKANEIFDQWLVAGQEKLGIELEPLLPQATNTQ